MIFRTLRSLEEIEKYSINFRKSFQALQYIFNSLKTSKIPKHLLILFEFPDNFENF